MGKQEQSEPEYTPGTPEKKVGMLDNGTYPHPTQSIPTKWPLPIISKSDTMTRVEYESMIIGDWGLRHEK